MALLAYQVPDAWESIAQAITAAYDNKEQIKTWNHQKQNDLKDQIETILDGIESGELSVARQQNEGWSTAAWIKQAILLYFQLNSIELIRGGFTHFADKVPLRFTEATERDFERLKTRVVPPACIRRGSYLGPNTVVMPSFINIGATVGEGSMIDIWAVVGSCAYIGKHVHLSSGAGIGGVLEPLQANPTIIEDSCFIGAGSEIMEGVIVGKGSVISMGVFINQSTKIYNRATGEISYGIIPPYSVVAPGQLPSSDGRYSLSCAIIVKQVDEKTRQKTAINDLLRLGND